MIARRVNWLFAAAALALTACGGSGPADTVKDFFRALERGDVDRALDLVSADSRAEVLRYGSADELRRGFREAAEELSEEGGIRSMETLLEEVDEGPPVRARVVLRLTTGNGETGEQEWRLVREDGRFKIVMEP